MSASKSIHVIHATDAELHLGKLREILRELEAENRILGHDSRESGLLNAAFFEKIGERDLFLILLTNGILDVKSGIEKSLRELKSNLPNCRIAEILVDNIPYDDHFMAFPKDLEPIRERRDMDLVWNHIAMSLREMFPVPPPLSPTPPEAPPAAKKLPWWKKWHYLLGALALFFVVSGLLILLILLWLLWLWIAS